MTARSATLTLHRYLGLASAAFLVVLGLTGAIIAFEGDVDHWLHPRLWYVEAKPPMLPEQQLIDKVEKQFVPSRVSTVQLRSEGFAQVMRVVKPGADIQVFINPYDGTVLGERSGQQTDEKVLSFIHQFHLRLCAGNFGRRITSIAGLILLVEVPLGMVLWWRTKRATMRWLGSSWPRACLDLHHVVGFYSAVFLFIAALTGVLIGFDSGGALIFALARSSPDPWRDPPNSAPADVGGPALNADRAMEIARKAIPGAAIVRIQRPFAPRASWGIQMRVPEETSETVHSAVYIDQYSGNVLRATDFSKGSLGYRIVRVNRSIHTGDIFGLPSHVLMSASSLLLVVMVVTGIVTWRKKLASYPPTSR